jgi:hemerythrin
VRGGVSTELTLQINKSIIDWVVQHIKVADKDIGKYINEQKSKTAGFALQYQ